jgi:hypothetical protein
MSRFSERLRSHDAKGRLVEAWDEFTRVVNDELSVESPDTEALSHGHLEFSGHRSTRRRWVDDKTHPYCRACVHALARVLDDSPLLDAWDADGAEHAQQRAFTDVSTRVSGLAAHLKRRLQEQLRVEIQQSEFSTRRSMHIGVRISPLTEALHRGEVTVRWRGDVPADAKVRIAGDREALMAAFADESCVYRDLLHLGHDELAAGYELLAARAPGRPPTELKFKQRGASSWTELTAHSSSPGCFEFANESIEEADVRLSVVFPCPAQYTCHPIQFGSYRVHGVARVSFRLAEGVSPHVPKLLVLPPDCATFVDRADNELSLELGDEDSLLPPATTALFYWSAT